MANTSNIKIEQDDLIIVHKNPTKPESTLANLKYLVVGVAFGIVFVKAEIISWFRIQEMFRLSSFHMYGVIGTAVVVGMISVLLIKRLGIKTLSGEKNQNSRQNIQQRSNLWRLNLRLWLGNDGCMSWTTLRTNW